MSNTGSVRAHTDWKARLQRTLLQNLSQIGLVVIGSIIAGVGYSLFQIPFSLAAGGIGGLAIFIGHYTGLPEGAIVFVINIPLLILGFYQLGRWRFIALALLSVTVASTAIDLTSYYVPRLTGAPAITDDALLAAIYGGIVTGIGFGLIYRSGGNPGGTAVTARILQRLTGSPLSQIYLYTDGLIVILAGTIFGWEVALLSMLTVFIGGAASDFVMEGPSKVRTATIVTENPDAVAQALMVGLHKGVSRWDVVGSYTGNTRTMLFCTVFRSQVSDLRWILHEADPAAFAVIGMAHQAVGTQFTPRARRTPPAPVPAAQLTAATEPVESYSEKAA